MASRTARGALADIFTPGYATRGANLVSPGHGTWAADVQTTGVRRVWTEVAGSGERPYYAHFLSSTEKENEMRMTIPRLETSSFEQLKAEKIRLRRMGRKHGVMYANVEAAMKRRFGRT
jgi:hypothetical protein